VSRQATLRADPTDWLLKEVNPSVRCFTLTDILEQSPRTRAVVQARRAIMARGPVPAILRRQNPDGGWAPPHRLYTSKYWGTVWTLIVLAELGADPDDERIQKACDHILEHSWSRTSGGFSTHPSKQGGGLESSVIPCLTGNMVFALARLGRAQDGTHGVRVSTHVWVSKKDVDLLLEGVNDLAHGRV